MTAVTKQTAPRIDRLLRSLVGVADVRLARASDDRLHAVHILSDACVQPHQLVRNVVSGLRAGFGVTLDISRVHVHADAAAFRAAAPAAPIAEPAEAEPVAPSAAAAYRRRSRPPRTVRPATATAMATAMAVRPA
jgi:hypothetical protein